MDGSVAVTPDGRSVWVSGDGGTGVLDTATGAVTHLLRVHSAGGIVFSPDGHRAYSPDPTAPPSTSSTPLPRPSSTGSRSAAAHSRPS